MEVLSGLLGCHGREPEVNKVRMLSLSLGCLVLAFFYLSERTLPSFRFYFLVPNRAWLYVE